MRPSYLVFGAAMMAAGAAPLLAQERAPRSMNAFVRVNDSNGDRAALGIETGSSGKRDTLGLLIESVTPGSPADKAGLEEGYRIASINGQNLKVAPGDAGEPDMAGLMTRRLSRELGKVKAGDEVTLELYADGAHKTLKVKTSALQDIGERRVRFSSDDYADRAAIGLGLDGGGSRRDTLGLLVTSLATDGPADKAGIEEGNRIARIDSIDLRVPASEAVGGALIGAKEQRFTRALEHLKAGDVVSLQVWADGAMKTVKVTTARAGDVYPENAQARFRFNFGDSQWMVAPMPPIPPMPPLPPTPRVRVFDNENDNIDLPQLRVQLQDLQRTIHDATQRASRETMRRSQGTLQQVLEGVRQARMAPMMERTFSDWPSTGDGHLMMTGDAGMMALGGLRLAPVSNGLSSYFGKGSENGLLVLDASDGWKPLRAGDVILSVNGTPVRDGDRTQLSLDTDRDNTLVVLRKGAKVTVVVKQR